MSPPRTTRGSCILDEEALNALLRWLQLRLGIVWCCLGLGYVTV